MGLSPRAAKALQQVEKDLYALYLAEHFSEDEWIRVDFAINKGKYVWTDGPVASSRPPPASILDEELIKFDQPIDLTPSHIDNWGNKAFDSNQQDGVSISLAEISGQSSGDECESPTGTSDTVGTSVQQESDDDTMATFSGLDLSKQRSQPAAAPPVSKVPDAPAEPFEVAKREVKPLPANGGLASGYTSAQLAEAAAMRKDFGIKSASAPLPSGPRSSLNSRSVSRASSRNVTTSPPENASKSILPRGKLLIARRAASKINLYTMNVRVGDSLKIISHLHGTTYSVQNVKTRAQGQVASTVFDAPPECAKAGPIASVKKRTLSQSTVQSHQFSDFEAKNASEWEGDEVPVSRSRAVVKEPKPTAAGSGTSRFAILADEAEIEKPNEETDASQLLSDEQKEHMSQLVDAKFAEILAGQKRSVSSAQSKHGLEDPNLLTNNPGLPYAPKTVTCWFWHYAIINPGMDGCRYPDEDCWNLHDYPDGPKNVKLPVSKNGKYHWASLADAAETEIPDHKSPFTCWFWAKTGKCGKSDESCKFMHANVRNGVAPRPKNWVSAWKGWKANMEYRAAYEEESNWRKKNAEETDGPFSWADESEDQWEKMQIESALKEAEELAQPDNAVLDIPPPSTSTW